MDAEKEQFLQLLNTLLSVDNDIRAQAEEAYNNIPVELKITHLIQAIQDVKQGEEAKTMAAVLLRRLCANNFDEFYAKLNIEAQKQLKERFLMLLTIEQSDNMRRKVCDVLSEVARNMIDDDGNNLWPEFLQFLFQCANSGNLAMKDAALRMFTAVPSIFGNQQSNYLDLIKQMLNESLQSPAYEIRFQAVRATGAFIISNEKDTPVIKHFMDLMPVMIRIITESIEKQEDDALIKVLIDMAESTPKCLRQQIHNIFDVCLKTLVYLESDSWRQLCLEVIVTLSETAPAMVRKNADKYIKDLIGLILQMMTDIDDDEEWSVSDEQAEDDNDSNSVVAESALDRLACGLGGKIVLPHILQSIPVMLTNEDWKRRHAALMAVSAAGEGCHKQMEAILPEIVENIVRYLQDPHPRVRFAACNALGQMSSDFAPTFEKKFHASVVPGLSLVLDDNENPRVQAHAGAALVNFSEDCPKAILLPYLDGLMGKLQAILNAKFQELVQHGTKLVLEQVVTTIASIADTVEDSFIPYYDDLMPFLKYIIQNASSDEAKLLRGKTIECVSLIGLAVGRDKFLPDAAELMNLLLKTHTAATENNEELADDDPQTSYLISAWTRICRIMGKQFEQYLPMVMGPVMRTASMKPDVALVDSDDMENIENDIDWQFISLGEQQNFGIRTAGLEDKATACEMLVCYARELKESFADYAEEVTRLMVPMLKFYFHDGVRTAAAESLPLLLECAKCKGPQYLAGMWNFICMDLLKAIDTDPELEVKFELMRSFAGCVETLGGGCLSNEAMQELLRILLKEMKDHFERAVKRHEKRLDEDYDEIVEEQLEHEDNEDVYTLNKVADIIHAMLSTYKTDFLPYFDELLNYFAQLLDQRRAWSDHQWGLCIFDDIIEFTGPVCIKYKSYFFAPMMAYVQDKQPAVRQAAAYGLGVLGQFGGEQFAQDVADALPVLVKVIQEPDSRTVEMISSTENVISAVTKILKYNNSRINVNEIIPLWLNWLPVYEDADEAPHVYGYLCDLIEANNVHVLGPDNINVPVLVRIIAAAFHKKAITPDNEVFVRLCRIVGQVYDNNQIFEACIKGLAPEVQQDLITALTVSGKIHPTAS